MFYKREIFRHDRRIGESRVFGVGLFFLVPTPLPFEWLKRPYDRRLVTISLATPRSFTVARRDPSPYRDLLDGGRSGLHYLGSWAVNYDAQIAAARGAGIRVAIQGKLPLSRFAYLETDALWPGTMVEIIEPQPTMLEMCAMIKAAACDWDGSEPLRTLG